MSMIWTTEATERLSRKLQAAGIDQWVVEAYWDDWGMYLRYEGGVGGRCRGRCGWSLEEAEEIVDRLIREQTREEEELAFLLSESGENA